MTMVAAWHGGAGAPTIDNPLILPLVPAARRDAVGILWALDQHMHAQISAVSEPALAQIRLRWWAEALGALRDGDAPPDPLLTSCATLLLPHVTGAELGALADAYFAVAADQDGPGRAMAGAILFTLTARILGDGAADIERDIAPDIAAAGHVMGLFWQAFDDGGADGAPADWAALAQALGALSLAKLPKPLAAIAAMARTIARARGRRRRLNEQAIILRVGLFGR